MTASERTLRYAASACAFLVFFRAGPVSGTTTGAAGPPRGAEGSLGLGWSVGTVTGPGTGGFTSVELTPSGFPRCGALDPARADDCDNLELIVPLSPDVSSMVDGSIEVGESSRVFSWVANRDSTAHKNVCLGVTANVPGIELHNALNETNPLPVGNLYAGATVIVTPAGKVVGDVLPGTIATFTFWTTYQVTNCLGPNASVDAEVKAYPFP